ncbi:diguanylate cyclase domain-containing protein [Chachezhania sediminis]|uniref:diguanylate cyclase domain-containing protein n=1 Tax=Chachezhania sediminis TaxID=2599291 RepID=UPI002D80EAD1|nr:diguanylate cyclase [Chachezhania sediminis]
MTEPTDLARILTRLCPMSLIVDDSGHILDAGPTLQKLCPESPLAGQRMLDLFCVLRPRSAVSMDDLMAFPAAQLRLQLRMPPATTLKGVLVPLPDGGAVINLSFGISVLDAVRDFSLTSTDFAPTDLAIELLYLVEAKSAAMEASRKLNLRLQGAKIAAEEQAFTDTLTGLKNRRAMNHVLTRLEEAGAAFSLMHLDLDYFKAVNDSLGHAAGDHVLQQAARIMVEETRQGDTVARIGGDEFVVVFDNLSDRARLEAIARRLIARLEQPIPFEGHACRVSASIGIAISSEVRGLIDDGLRQRRVGRMAGAGRADRDGDHGARPCTDGEAGSCMLHLADLALYKAKRSGRACHRFFTEDFVVPGGMGPFDSPDLLVPGDPRQARGSPVALASTVAPLGRSLKA